jgi:hypothetical protein
MQLNKSFPSEKATLTTCDCLEFWGVSKPIRNHFDRLMRLFPLRPDGADTLLPSYCPSLARFADLKQLWDWSRFQKVEIELLCVRPPGSEAKPSMLSLKRLVERAGTRGPWLSFRAPGSSRSPSL